MDGATFEEFLDTLFRQLGYRVENTRYRGDYGADLVVSKDGFKTAVQAKRWSKRIGVKAVQEAVASAGYYKCHRALGVANRDFTKQARVLAHANNVELWDRDTLVSKLLAVRGEAAPAEPFVVANAAPALTAAEVAPASNDAADRAHCVTWGRRLRESARLLPRASATLRRSCLLLHAPARRARAGRAGTLLTRRTGASIARAAGAWGERTGATSVSPRPGAADANARLSTRLDGSLGHVHLGDARPVAQLAVVLSAATGAMRASTSASISPAMLASSSAMRINRRCA